MKLFAVVVLSLAVAPIMAQDQNPVAAPPAAGTIEMDTRSHCTPVHAGDTVSYTLTITDLAAAQTIYAELQMRPGKHGHFDAEALPAAGANVLNGAGSAVRDERDANVYHVSFVVPKGVTPGVYHGVGVNVLVNGAANQAVDVSRHTNEQIRSYCLAVFNGVGSGYPEVTNFKPGAAVRKQ